MFIRGPIGDVSQSWDSKDMIYRLNTNVFLSARLRETHRLSVWERPEWTDAGLGSVTTFVEKEDEGSSIILPRFTSSSCLYQEDVFLYLKVFLGNDLLWAEKTTPALSGVKVHLLDIDLGAAEKDKEKETGLGETEHKKAELPTEGDKSGRSGHQDAADHTVQVDEVMEDGLGKQKDKSIRRRLIHWFDEMIHNYYRKKIAETYRREREEGRQFYPSTFYFIRPMSRADRERQKRETWLDRDNQRQDIRKLLDSWWEEKRKKKELLRKTEEERHENWAAEHGAGASTCPPGEPKKRLSKWDKSFLSINFRRRGTRQKRRGTNKKQALRDEEEEAETTAGLGLAVSCD
ncbi:hypothetical protein Q5P01_025737 [Channa striata]|uniref:Uncharacterized protein n=1 Tax=Channa striata TaxID=64152 RepID=A0AA88LM31_CHASR|nr:hypothetical protein Q5P01_025737 [Channa striata]